MSQHERLLELRLFLREPEVDLVARGRIGSSAERRAASRDEHRANAQRDRRPAERRSSGAGPLSSTAAAAAATLTAIAWSDAVEPRRGCAPAYAPSPASVVSMPSNMSGGAIPGSPIDAVLQAVGADRRLRRAGAAAATCPGTCACCALRGRARCTCGRAADRIRRSCTRSRSGAAAPAALASRTLPCRTHAWPATAAALRGSAPGYRDGSAAARNASTVSRVEA